jgi:Protein of unknown function (DUF2721)
MLARLLATLLHQQPQLHHRRLSKKHMDASSLAAGIQLSVAPVFLLTAVATLIGALASRLGRVVDRARMLEDLIIEQQLSEPRAVMARTELGALKHRTTLINLAMMLLVLCAIFIGITILELFIGEVGAGRTAVLSSWVPWTFGGGLAAFIAALMCFLREVLLASQSLNIGMALASIKQDT